MAKVEATAQNTITHTNVVQIEGGSRLISERPFHLFRISYGPQFDAGEVELANRNIIQVPASEEQVFFIAWQMTRQGPVEVAKWMGNASVLTSGEVLDVTFG